MPHGVSGSTRLFRALFQYLPLRDSPNEQPQLELSLAPGDLILVRGEMDDDGFYRGETMDGVTGLVPSNYVERLPDSWLAAAREPPGVANPTMSTGCMTTLSSRPSSPSFQLNIPAHLAAIQHDFTDSGGIPLPDSVCPYPPADVSRVTVQEIKEGDSSRVPWPRDIVVEKRMSRSVVVSWSPPEESFIAISQYHVCIDGLVRTVVPGSYKCRALVEDVNLDGSSNLSIRAVTEHGHSPDAACTISIGAEASIAPQHLRVWSVTPVSACIRWYPSNSNADHVVSLNAVKIGVCPPSVFQVQVQGLTPSTIYRLSVRTKHPKAVLEQRPVERCIDFKTLPKIGLPDPPSNVQVDIGPQPGTLLVSWSPVANQPKSPSRAAVHSYLVYADGRNIAQVPTATADHVLLRLADLSDDPPIFITVRTRTKEGSVSSDSNVARVPRAIPSFPLSTNPLSPIVLPQPSHQPLQTLTNIAPLSTGPLSDPLPKDHMASSYPSATYSYPVAATQYAHYRPSAGVQPGAVAASLLNTVPTQSLLATQPQAPYSAPVIAPSSLPQYSTNLIPSYGNSYVVAAPAELQTVSVPPAVASAGTSLPTWKTSVPNQYYTFHPRLIRSDGSRPPEDRPSVLEMENNYVLRHRQSEWGTASRDAYGRQARTVSMEGPGGVRTPRLVPPRLARVKCESGFGTRSEPDLRPPIMDDDCRWFVALFDYNHHMSPNANAEHEELSFRKHQLIKVYGEQDPDGFFHGQIGNRVGLVPSNMVIEIAKDDLLPRRVPTTGGPVIPGEAPALRRARWGSLKSRSYDHADRRSGYHHRTDYASLDRRDRDTRDRDIRDPRDRDIRDRERTERDIRERERTERERERSGHDRYRRSNGRDYEYRREYDDREREREIHDRHPREPYYEEEYPRRTAERRHDGYSRTDDYDRREWEREKDTSRYDGQQPGPSSQHNHTNHLVQPGNHYTTPSTAPQPQQPWNPQTPGPSQPQQNHVNQLPQQMNHLSMGSGPKPGLQPAMGSMGGNMSAMSGMPPNMSQSSMGMGMMQQQQPQPQQQQYMDGGGVPVNGLGSKRVMVAKFDYDSRQLSPNVDAEQVELSFRQGDAITIYGEMDEDGFYMGELNGERGLVPSNFLQTSPLTHLAPSLPMEPLRKGVAFQETKKTPIATTSSSAPTKPAPKKTSVAQPGGTKPLAKKTSDVSKTPNARKTSAAVKKADPAKKK